MVRQTTAEVLVVSLTGARTVILPISAHLLTRKPPQDVTCLVLMSGLIGLRLCCG